jgi:hypothetical protein
VRVWLCRWGARSSSLVSALPFEHVAYVTRASSLRCVCAAQVPPVARPENYLKESLSSSGSSTARSASVNSIRRRVGSTRTTARSRSFGPSQVSQSQQSLSILSHTHTLIPSRLAGKVGVRRYAASNPGLPGKGGSGVCVSLAHLLSHPAIISPIRGG